jgi:hypothetical protein
MAKGKAAKANIMHPLVLGDFAFQHEESIEPRRDHLGGRGVLSFKR